MGNTGIHYLDLSEQQVNDFWNNGLNLTEYDFRPNDYIVVKHKGEVQKKLRLRSNPDMKLTSVDVPFMAIGKGKTSFKPLNVEQELMFDLLNNDNVPIKVLQGIAGTGKTKSALKFGFEKLSQGIVDKIIIVRNVVSIGEKVGYFKGDKDDKLMKWNSPARDNLENDRQESLEELVENGTIQLEIPDTMQGRDIKKAWIIVDEAQYLTHDQVKMIGERVSQDTMIVFCGDVNQIYNQKFKGDNGFKDLINLRGHHLIGFVELTEDVRSETSKLFATLY